MKTQNLGLVPVLPLLACFGLAGADVTVNAGEWLEASGSHLESVQPNPLPDGYFSAVMEAWSGGAFDSKRDRFIVWGGGHSDYAGNEVYAFDAKSTLKWTRVNNPSTNVGGDEKTGLYPDGTPRSEHSYDHIVYVPPIDRFCSLGAGGTYPGGQIGTNKTMCFDFDAKKWEQKANTLSPSTSAVAAYDAETQKVWMHGTNEESFLSAWDPVKDVWTKYAAMNAGLDYYHTAAAGRGYFLALGAGDLYQWDLKNPSAQPVRLKTTGDTEIEGAQSPGFVFAGKSGYFVAWKGGSAVYVLDVGTKKWTKVTVAGTNKVTPTSADPRGTYGRFQYIPSMDAFVGVNATDQNVYLYRLPASLPPASVKKNEGGAQNLMLDMAPFGRLVSLHAYGRLVPGADLTVRLLTLRSDEVWQGRGNYQAGRPLRLISAEGAASPASLPAAPYALRIEQGRDAVASGMLVLPSR